MVWEQRCPEDLEDRQGLVKYSVNHKGICSTAPATPGLLLRQNYINLA